MAKEKSFEEDIQQLEAIVKRLESGEESLDTAIQSFTEAMKLAKTCDEKLKSAEEQINKILTEDGKLQDFTVEEK
ncbi:MAG: exodeoxyribonuclease VII small subunit [Firmicutes bacterium]|nr:exodeoxyribonuclease VII small subunit [Bacillota bacterium]